MYLASKQAGRLNHHVAEVNAFAQILVLRARNAWQVKASVSAACSNALSRLIQLRSSTLPDRVAFWTDVVGLPVVGARVG